MDNRNFFFWGLGVQSNVHSKTEKRDGWNRLTETIDSLNKSTYFSYDAFNNLVRTKDSLNNLITIEYDRLGRRTKLLDPDLGQISYVLDPLGRVQQQVSPNQRKVNQSIMMYYDNLGRMTSRIEPDLKSYWVYDNQAQQNCVSTRSCGKLIESYTLNGSNKENTETHSYDSLGRPSVTTQQRDVLYTHTIGYDSWGRMLEETHTRSGGAVKKYERRYNAYGAMYQVLRATGANTYQVLWQANDVNARGQSLKAALGNSLTDVRSYYPSTGLIQYVNLNTVAGVSQAAEAYVFDKLGNVTNRTQTWATDKNGASAVYFSEDFEYDALNRLAKATVTGKPVQTFLYDELGNLINKTGVGSGSYVYNSSGSTGFDATSGASLRRPHAVQSIPGLGSFVYDDNGNLVNGGGRTVSWTSFDMPSVMSKGSDSSTFIYGADHQRVKQVRSDGVTTYYAGAMEVENKAGVLTVKTYWPAGLGLEVEKDNAAAELLWTHHDRIGSVIAITNSTGALEERMAYDSWGKRRTLDGGEDIAGSIDGVKDNRGYTGHEMLDKLDLVHMNGRIYDPFTARFMSPDPIIQDPLHSQSYNRYTYVWNNPTNLTDPTGFEAEGGCGYECRNQREADKIAERCAREVSCSYFGPGRPNRDGENSASGSADKSGERLREVIAVTVRPTVNRDGVETAEVTYHREKIMEDRPIRPSGDRLILEFISLDIVSIMLQKAGMSEKWADRTSFASAFINPKQLLSYAGKKVSLGTGKKIVEEIVENCACCFVADTPILTDKGLVPISEIQVGTLVMSRNEKTGETALKPVTALIHSEGRQIYAIVLLEPDGKVTRIESSDNHPFWVKGRGWVDSAQLKRGMKVSNFDKKLSTVVNVEDLGRTDSTYNLTVADFHTFFAGDGRAFVHNCNSCGINWKKPWIVKDVYNKMSKSLPDSILLKFVNALSKEAKAVGDNGIKMLKGNGVKLGGETYKFELKIMGDSGGARLYGNRVENGQIQFTRFESGH